MLKILRIISVWLMIIGSINWGIVALAECNLVTSVFGVNTLVTKIIYVLIGLSGVYHGVIAIMKKLPHEHKA